MGGGGSKTKIFDPLAGTGVRDIYSQLGAQVTPQFGQLFQQPTSPMYAGPGGMQQQIFGGAGGYLPDLLQTQRQLLGSGAGGVMPGLAQGMGALSEAAAPYESDAGRRYWESAFVRPAMEQWSDISSRVMEPYAGRNAADSGAMMRALAREGGRVSTGLSGQLANILYSGEQARLGRLPQVGGLMAGLPLSALQGTMGALGGLMDIGGIQQALQQQQVSEPWQRLGMTQQTLGQYIPQILNEPGLTAISQQQGPGIAGMLGPGIGSFLGTEAGAGALAGGLGSLFGGIGGLFGGGAAAGAPSMAALAPFISGI
jgi:hypothetical protein